MKDGKDSSLILIVDDSLDNQQVLSSTLASDGRYRFQYASDGEQALMLLDQYAFDLVLLDVVMPEIDGYETCRRIRATPAYADVPVVMVTGLNGREAMLKGIDAGADDFVSKPLDADELRARVRSITRLNRFRRRLEQTERADFLEFYDPLTRLANRKRFTQQLTAALTRRSDAPFVVAALGIDGFDEISNTLGPDVGDRILQEAAHRLKAEIARDGDLARLAGACFLALLRLAPDAAAEAGERMRAVLRQPFAVGSQNVFLTACIGTAACPKDGDSAELLTANAAAAMSAARAEGRDAQLAYASSMNVAVLRRLTIENRLREGLQENRLELRFQPRFDLLSGAMTAAEVVVCWRDGAALGDLYYEVAELSGLSREFGQWLFDSAGEHLAGWRRQGVDAPRLTIPVGCGLLSDPIFPEWATALLQRHGLPGSALELALAECALKPSRMPAGLLTERLARLKALDLRLTIDRFGADSLTLAQLARLPVDGLLIDAALVRSLFESISHGAVTKSIIGLAQNLDLFAVAKGVSSDEQRTFLLSWRCDEVQGPLFSDVLSADALAQRCRQSRAKGDTPAVGASDETRRLSGRLARQTLLR